MGKLINGLFSKQKGAQEDNVARRGPLASQGFDIEELVETLYAMPIGRKVHYCPEFKREISLETIIIGYAINGYLIFSAANWQAIESPDGPAIEVDAAGTKVHITEIKSFCFVVPYNPDDESKIDYTHRAEIGTRGVFANGNSLTLSAREANGLVRMMDTTVLRHLAIKEGVYANYQVVLLDLIPETVVSTDRRRHHRLRTNVPAAIYLEKQTIEGSLVDYSGESIRLVFTPNSLAGLQLAVGKSLEVKITLKTHQGVTDYRLKGVIQDGNSDSLVVNLQGIFKQSDVVAFGIIDRLDLKSNLLQQPETLEEDERDL